MFRASVIFLLLMPAASVCAQQKPITVSELHANSAIDIFSALKNVPPDLTLVPKELGGRTGQLWIRNLGNALLIAGQVDGPAPQFAQSKNDILAKDHIEVWLAAAMDVAMPSVGWGNQFGEQLLPKGPDSCTDWIKENGGDAPDKNERQEKCRVWAAQQQQYRNVFKKLFVRQWLLTPDYSSESYATPAYDLITTKYAAKKNYPDQVPALLKPKGTVQMTYVAPYRFQVQIPYSAFPPANTLELKNLWLMVDVFGTAPPGKKMGAYSSSSSLRVFGKPETFNRLELRPSRSFEMTPCEYGLEGMDKYWEEHKGWFIPAHDQGPEFEADSFIVVNEAEGYAYEPTGLSPVVRPIHHFWHNLGPNEWVCGPRLAYQKGESSKHFNEAVAEDRFDAKRLNDGTLLIRSGPRVYYSEFGSGQCGACPRYELRVFALDPSLKLNEALFLGGVVQGDNDAVDFSLSRNWSQILQFQEQGMENNENAKPTWSATTYCLTGRKYVKCDEKNNVQPPDPPLLKELREESN